MPEFTNIKISVPELNCSVTGKVCHSRSAKAFLVLAHGAGAGMNHPFMEELSKSLHTKKVSTLRFQFPYMENGHRLPDRFEKCCPVIRNAWLAGLKIVGDSTPIFLGGKSMGGRFGSLAVDYEREVYQKAAGLIFVGFPLHSIKKPGTERANHLPMLQKPMLFVQGTKDKMAQSTYLTQVMSTIKEMGTLITIPHADHSFAIAKKNRSSEESVESIIAAKINHWITEIPAQKLR